MTGIFIQERKKAIVENVYGIVFRNGGLCVYGRKSPKYKSNDRLFQM